MNKFFYMLKKWTQEEIKIWIASIQRKNIKVLLVTQQTPKNIGIEEIN